MNTKILNYSSQTQGPSKKINCLLAVPVNLYHSLTIKDYWIILFISCLALYAPALWSVCAVFLCYKTLGQFRQCQLAQMENAQSMVVQSVELNQLQNLSKAIESNPEILYCDYQRRSLIAWCRYYKNTHAQDLIVQMMKKYPKEASAA